MNERTQLHLEYVDDLDPTRVDYSPECLVGLGLDPKLLVPYRTIGFDSFSAINALLIVAGDAGVEYREGEPFHRFRIRVRRKLLEQGGQL